VVHPPAENHHVENFTFVDVPKDELQAMQAILTSSKQQRINPSMISRKTETAANQQDQVVEETKSASRLSRNHHRSEQSLASIRFIVEGNQSPQPIQQQTLSNGSILTFYDESNQSIAQEFKGEEATVRQVIPSSAIM